MTEDDKSALKEVASGAITTISCLGVFIIVMIVLSNITTTASNPIQSNSEVVGQYKECDIIRWNQHGMAEYKYFLYCEKNNVSR
jgi:hypothetical protein